MASRIIHAVCLLVCFLTPPSQGEDTTTTGSILKGYVTGPIHSASAAITQALAVMGLDSASATAKASQRILTEPPEIPFLHEQLKGKEAWSVSLSGVELTSLSATGEVAEHGYRDFHVLLDSSNGKVLSITSTSSIEVPDLRSRPSVERAEELLAGERYEGFPDEPPGVTFLQALDEAWHKAGADPLTAKDIDVLYVIQSEQTRAASPVWVIALRGVSPIIAHPPPGGEEPPVWMRNCVSHVVDARTGRHLFAANAPYPRTVAVALIKGEEQEPVISYFTRSKTSLQEPRPRIQVLTVVWSDGRIIWSQDRLQGGPPYFEAHIEKRTIRGLFDRLEREDLFNRSELNRPYSDPEAEASSLVIADGTRELSMTSCHELAELDPEIVATSQGLVHLEGKTREEVRADEQDDKYVLFRAAWDEAREGLLGLIPTASGTPLGVVEFEKRVVPVDKHER